MDLKEHLGCSLGAAMHSVPFGLIAIHVISECRFGSKCGVMAWPISAESGIKMSWREIQTERKKMF